ncbi:MAG: class II fructose-bisphosphate aldolase [Spirochaetales bacterium]|nr:class II fructose-bisphosphate aldolase [Spirochaetales bacterium]
MSCVNMNAVLPKAKRQGYAVGAFNILDYASMRAVVQAAQELTAPVIIQTSVKTILLWGYRTVHDWYRELGDAAAVPVVLHLDHCKDLEIIQTCIETGWTSVMIDASSKPFEENLELTSKVVEMARLAGVSVEAELGEISGVEDEQAVEASRLADPEKAVQFCKRVDLDLLAPAIGTAHGIYKGEPHVDFERMDKIARGTGLPLALHGGTGLPDEVFRRSISLGCAKVNISTSLKHVFIDSFEAYRSEHPQEYEPVKLVAHQMEALKQNVAGFVRLFGSQGKA